MTLKIAHLFKQAENKVTKVSGHFAFSWKIFDYKHKLNCIISFNIKNKRQLLLLSMLMLLKKKMLSEKTFLWTFQNLHINRRKYIRKVVELVDLKELATFDRLNAIQYSV